MPWSGGAFTRTNGVHTGSTLWAQDRDAGTKILASRHDSHDQDFADGFNSTLEKSGSNAATGNLNIGSNRLTAVADGTAKTDAATVNQIQSNAPAFQATDTGTANAYVIALSPAVTAYAAGQAVTFKAGAASTTASTLNVNGLGVKAIKKLHDQDIASGDIESGSIVTVVYDGTNFQMTSQVATEASGVSLSGSTANTVTTVTGADALIGEAKLLFDPPNLTIGNATAEDVAIVYDGNAKDFYIGLDDSEDKLVVGVGSTVGTNNILTLTDDAVTVGDGAAVDPKIVFDGNAQDFYMGLDDTDDSFKIGLGTAVGTTAHIISDASGRVTKPLQPLFLVRSPGASNVTGGGTQYTVVASNEIYDIGSNWSSATFTAPVTGKYLLGGSIYISGLTASMDSCSFGVITSNYTAGYWFFFGNIGAMRDNNNAFLINGSIVADMDASDTAVFKIQINGGSDVADIGASDTNLFGALVA